MTNLISAVGSILHYIVVVGLCLFIRFPGYNELLLLFISCGRAIKLAN